ncbi:hypothetical protein, partial [Acinetobacter baumannii]|uniref:hypothetical protein n=1 Tax=Acinetobacter baumannii TaxID=470 RepID=UPI001E4A23C4
AGRSPWAVGAGPHHPWYGGGPVHDHPVQCGGKVGLGWTDWHRHDSASGYEQPWVCLRDDPGRAAG